MIPEHLEGEPRRFGTLFGLLASVERTRSLLRPLAEEAAVFTLDADPQAFDLALTGDRLPPGSIDHVAERVRASSLDLAACMELDPDERAHLVELWLDPFEGWL